MIVWHDTMILRVRKIVAIIMAQLNFPYSAIKDLSLLHNCIPSNISHSYDNIYPSWNTQIFWEMMVQSTSNCFRAEQRKSSCVGYSNEGVDETMVASPSIQECFESFTPCLAAAAYPEILQTSLNCKYFPRSVSACDYITLHCLVLKDFPNQQLLPFCFKTQLT